MAESELQPMGPRRWVTAFRLGLAAGVLLPVAAYVWYASTIPQFEVDLRSPGAVIDKHSAQKVVLDDGKRRMLTQTCNGACDDLRYRAASGEGVVGVTVLDATGKCVLCRHEEYVTGGLTARMAISGERELSVADPPE